MTVRLTVLMMMARMWSTGQCELANAEAQIGEGKDTSVMVIRLHCRCDVGVVVLRWVISSVPSVSGVLPARKALQVLACSPQVLSANVDDMLLSSLWRVLPIAQQCTVCKPSLAVHIVSPQINVLLCTR